jgi:chemotaxis protein methyltransferase CheR
MAVADGSDAVEDLEIDLLLEGIFRRFGTDFRGYRRAVLRDKLHDVMTHQGLRTVSGLLERVMHDVGAADTLLRVLGSHPASLFDDPGHYRAMREVLVPWLCSSPAPRIWVAECVTAEEVCSLAILLEEEGLLERTQIYATSANEDLLHEASRGSFPAERLPVYEENYRRSGGKGDLRLYLDMGGGQCSFARSLRENVTWAQYNIATDASFNEFQLISCRGALGEFDSALRHRALQLFHDSVPVFGLLSVDGDLCAGTAPFARCYQLVRDCQGLYRRVS